MCIISDNLTICIPTYNRKEQLERLLRSLINQEDVRDVSIVICDNHSDYDVITHVDSIIPNNLKNNVCVFRNKFNVGACQNIASTFSCCQTKWMWLIGDDDIATPDSISMILEDIKNRPDVSMIKYSIDGSDSHAERDIESLDDIISYLETDIHGGDMIFLSNNVYNTDKLSTYIGNAYIYGYTQIPQLLPAFAALDESDGIIHFSSKKVVRYFLPEGGIQWNFLSSALGLTTFVNIRYKSVTNYQRHRLCYLLARDFGFTNLVKNILELESRNERLWSYKIIYNTIFKYANNYKYQIINILFNVQHFTRINILGCFLRVFNY